MLLTTPQQQALLRLGRLGASRGDSQDFLRSVVTTAAEFFLPLRVECGITVHNHGQLVSVAQSHPGIEVIEELQNPDEGGPVFHSLERGSITVVGEALSDPRWPQYLHLVVRHGYHSILSVPLATTDASRATINFYAEPPRSFTSDLRVAAEYFAAATAQHLRVHLTRGKL